MSRKMLPQYLSEYFCRKLVVYIHTIIRQFYQIIIKPFVHGRSQCTYS
jgi:hypothetical protein